jgi:chromosome segregation ATPase
MGKLKNQYENYQDKFKDLSTKYEAAVKEKMLMKLEKDRLMAKVENLEQNLRQIEDGNDADAMQKAEIAKRLEKQASKQAEGKSQMKPLGAPTPF